MSKRRFEKIQKIFFLMSEEEIIKLSDLQWEGAGKGYKGLKKELKKYHLNLNDWFTLTY